MPGRARHDKLVIRHARLEIRHDKLEIRRDKLAVQHDKLCHGLRPRDDVNPGDHAYSLAQPGVQRITQPVAE